MERTGGRSVEADLLTDPPAVSLSAVSFVTTFGVMVVSPTVPTIADAFAVPEAEIGLVMTAYTLPGILTVPIMGVLADVYGRRVVLLPAFFLSCLLGVSIAFADSFASILAYRLGQGAVTAGIMPLVTTMIGDLYTGSVGSTAQGIRLSANGLSMVVVPATAGFLSGFAWNYPFLLYVLGTPVLALAYVTLPETGTRSDGRGLRADFRAYVGSLRSVATDRTVVVLVAGGFVRGAGLYALLTFLPLFAAQNLGATAFVIGVVLATRGVVRILVSPFTGRTLGVLSRKSALLLGLGFIVGSTVLVPVTPSPFWLGVAFGLFGIGDALFIPIHRDSVAALTPQDSRAGALSGVSLCRKVGTTVSPVFFGVVLAVFGFDAVFVLVGGLFAAYAIALAVFFAEA